MKAKIDGFLQALRPTTGRLALSYLAIIMAMSIGFSYVFYRTSAHELGRQLPVVRTIPLPDNTTVVDFGNYRDFFERRINEGRGDLLGKLILLNLLTLVGGAFLSYYLARRTLEPIEKAMDAQSRFASDASHELRTPLTVMQTENEVALRNPELTLKRAKELLRSNVEEVTRLRDLSDGLLRLARGDHALDMQPVWLDDVASDAMNAVLKTAQAKEISIDETVPHVQALGDRQSLVQALVILLDNAIKYSDKKSVVHLKGSAGKQVSLSVHDQGIGIGTEHLPHIFDRFYRADQARSKQQTSGYGLGLAIAKKIVEQHHGEIHVASAPNKGATFTVRLPRAEG
ncbi:MAG TPA: HAMP domain-containing sensor histidine kinase [Candidatus Saccharimonadales bacterium]|nr:HAMP domain-containing sensor histidine kinase [Candidatus Saccharimonadales bacterium]